MDIHFISRLDWLFRFSKCINKLSTKLDFELNWSNNASRDQKLQEQCLD